MTKSTLLDINESDNMDRVLYHFFKASKTLTYSERRRFRLSKPFGTRVCALLIQSPSTTARKKTPSSQNLCCYFATFLFFFSIAIIPPDHLINCINFGCLLEFPLSLSVLLEAKKREVMVGWWGRKKKLARRSAPC